VGAQVRAHGEEIPATAWAEGERVEVRLQRRIRGVSPGQSVVLYDGTRVVGSATIARATTIQVATGKATAGKTAMGKAPTGEAATGKAAASGSPGAS
jgi:tRNA-specific 2-thiouridylase